MKKMLILTSLLLLGLSVSIAQKNASIKYSEFTPIEPIEFYDDVEVTVPGKGEVKYKYIKTLDKNEMLRFLTNETVMISVAEIDKEGNMRYIPERVSEKGKQYIVTMDYLKFSTIDIRQQGDIIGEAATGIGFRVIINISSRAKDVNLGDLFAIGMAASDKKIYGSLRVEAIGMHDPEITSVIPLPSEVSGASIQTVMQAITTIKYKIYDKSTNLSPQIVGVRVTKDGISMQEMREIVMRYHLLGKKNAPQKPEAND
jgi:hypothetical protein